MTETLRIATVVMNAVTLMMLVLYIVRDIRFKKRTFADVWKRYHMLDAQMQECQRFLHMMTVGMDKEIDAVFRKIEEERE